MKNYLILAIISLFVSCDNYDNGDIARTWYFPKSEVIVKKMPAKSNTWVFILAGQSNMAGYAFVEPQDTIPDNRVLSINSKGELILAKEPLSFYDPNTSSLGCGLAFGKTLAQEIPDSISILIIPTAISGTSIQDWLGDSTRGQVSLLSNFREKVAIGSKYGIIKAILWHQGENDANQERTAKYPARLSQLTSVFRTMAQNDTLPILMGELGSYSEHDQAWQLINQVIRNHCKQDNNASIINTQDLKDKGDKVHFNSESQREMGKRFANAYLKKFK